MSKRSNLVNLDAMIVREDFAAEGPTAQTVEVSHNFALRELMRDGFMGRMLRKPDFQRETNHWSPEQVVSLLECFVNSDLIPSVILWQSNTYLFVIDGGHRLSALKAWVADDYGDGAISAAFFGNDLPKSQRESAERCRSLVARKVGAWSQYQAALDAGQTHYQQFSLAAVSTRALPIQWVRGDADKAESSFFKINTKGTPLDNVEEMLLRHRRKPISIAARAVIRAGKGHRYWSRFGPDVSAKIETLAKKIHKAIFDPEVEQPLKTLDLPLGGSKGVRTALQVLIDFSTIACGTQAAPQPAVESFPDDLDGSLTLDVLNKTYRLASRITGNEDGSLGLHPAVYFYGPSGRHSEPMFMGTVLMIGRKLMNNDGNFFQKFTAVRRTLESIIISNKDMISNLITRTVSSRRVQMYSDVLESTIRTLSDGGSVGPEDLVRFAGFEGSVIIGHEKPKSSEFSDDTKSTVMIKSALSSAVPCALCNGLLDPQKSLSYDHIKEKRNGGMGGADNLQLTHPYCNQARR